MKIKTKADVANHFQHRYRWVPIARGQWWQFWNYDAARIVNLPEQVMALLEAMIIGNDGGIDVDKVAEARRIIVAWCWVGADGMRLFDPDSKDDLKQLAMMDGRTVETIYVAAREHCGYTEVDIAGLAAQKEIQNVIQVLPMLLELSVKSEATPESNGMFQRLAKDWTEGKVHTN